MHLSLSLSSLGNCSKLAGRAFGLASSFNDIQLFGTGSNIAKGKRKIKSKTFKGIGKKGKANKDNKEQVTKKQING